MDVQFSTLLGLANYARWGTAYTRVTAYFLERVNSCNEDWFSYQRFCLNGAAPLQQQAQLPLPAQDLAADLEEGMALGMALEKALASEKEAHSCRTV